jgi:glycerol uptake facilitator-like aquaporin
MKHVSLRQSAAEGIGTFLLAFGVGLTVAVQNFPLPTVLVAGIILMTIVYTIGPVSGAQVNPAITLGLLSIRKISLQQAVTNIVAQLIAGIVAFWALHFLGAPVPPAMPPLSSIAGEVIGAFVLAWGVASVVYGKVQDAASGLTIGGSLMAGVVVASFGSLGILNPAVAVAVGAGSAVYLAAPFFGGVIGMQVYHWVVNENKKK